MTLGEMRMIAIIVGKLLQNDTISPHWDHASDDVSCILWIVTGISVL